VRIGFGKEKMARLAPLERLDLKMTPGVPKKLKRIFENMASPSH
jgi:hypothetical protein